MKYRHLLRFIAAAVTLHLAANPLFANCTECDGKVKVIFYGDFCANSGYTITLNGVSSTGPGNGCSTYTSSSKATTYLLPLQEYTVTASSSGQICSDHISYTVPSCYTMFIKEAGGSFEEKTATDGSGGNPYSKSWTIIIKPLSDEGGPGTAGDGGGGVGSVHWSFSLGGLASGGSAGNMAIEENTISSASYTPATLIFATPSPEISLIKSGSAIRQVKAPEVLADVVTISATKYEIRYFLASQVAGFSSGLYNTTGSPFVIWTVENPDLVNPGKMRISETRSGVIKTNDFALDTTTGDWTLTQGGVRSETRNTITLVNGDRLITTVIKNPTTGIVSSKRVEVRHSYLWGDELIQTIDDPDGAALTTTYTFGEDPSEFGSYSRLVTTVHPDGSWEKLEYPDEAYEAGHPSEKFIPWKDTPTNPNAADDYNCRYDEYYYYPDGTHFGNYLGGEYLTVLGNIVGPKFYSQYTHMNSINGLSEPVTERGSWIYDTQYHLIRYNGTSVSFKSTASPYLAGHPYKVTYPDGRVDSYSYSLGTFNESTGVFTAGTGTYSQQTLVHGTSSFLSGIANRTTREITVRDLGGKSLLEQEEVYNGTSYETVSTTRHFYTSEGRLSRTELNGRITYEATWSAGRLQSETDESGIVTTYNQYDDLDRIISETRAGVTTSYIYDADSRILSTTLSGGGLSLVNSTTYDKSGRIKTQTDNAGLVTTWDYSANDRVTTKTFPNGGTEITEKYLDGRVKSITGTGVVNRFYDYGAGIDELWTKESIGSANSPRYKITVTDNAGNVIRTEQPGYAATVQAAEKYDYSGRQISNALPGEAPLLTAYDELGQESKQGRDLDATGSLETSGVDPVDETEYSYLKENLQWYRVTKKSRYESYDLGIATTLSLVKEQLTGLPTGTISKTISIDRRGNSTTQTVTVNRTTRTVTQTIDTPDSDLDAVQVTVDGRLFSSSTNTVSQPTQYEYDLLGRLHKVTDPRGVESITAYNTQGQTESLTVAGLQTSYQYYAQGTSGAGQLKYIQQPDSTRIYKDYNLHGDLIRTWGAGTYPVEYIIDNYGQRTQLKTFRGGSGWDGSVWPSNTGTADVTTWNYQESSGLLLNKADAQSHSVSYTYNGAGKPATRTWARGTVTKYYYDLLGQPLWIDYSDSTPDISYSHDRAGRRLSSTDAAGTHSFAYTNAGDTESVGGGIQGVLTYHTIYDGFGRTGGVEMSFGGATDSTTYNFDSRSRLGGVTSGLNTVTYGYLANSDLLETTTFARNGLTAQTTTRTWDSKNRLKKINHQWTGGGSQSFDTTDFDTMNRRKTTLLEDGTSWTYGYNDRGEVTSGNRLLSGGGALPGRQYGYNFDSIGNRLDATVNGRTASYSANSLNQITSRTIPGTLDVLGTASTSTSVTVNTQAATRNGTHFYKTITADNTSAPVNVAVSINATGTSGTTTRTGSVLLPKTPEAPGYDLDGNLTSDSRFTYTWDAENRLIKVESLSSIPTDAKRKLAFAYDAQGRRIRKQVWHWINGGWLLYDTLRFCYDRWNLLAEYGDTGRRVRTYVWGQDVSGSLQGAGGIGGLLFETNNFAGKTDVPAYDLNGNITAMLDAGNSLPDAQYEYGPFGELVRSSGEYALLNPFRFSTKYTDDESGLAYYGYRYYSTTAGRWISRDPIEEKGGVNLYAILANKITAQVDCLGLEPGKEYNDAGEAMDAAHKDVFDATSKTIQLGKDEMEKDGYWAHGQMHLGPHYSIKTGRTSQGYSLYRVFGIEYAAVVYRVCDNKSFYSYGNLIEGYIPKEMQIAGQVDIGPPRDRIYPSHKQKSFEIYAAIHTHSVEVDPAEFQNDNNFSAGDKLWAKTYNTTLYLVNRANQRKPYP